MQRHSKRLIELFSQSGRFDHVFRVAGFVFVARQLNDLTAFCAPSIRARDHQSAVLYDYGLTVLSGEQSEDNLIDNLNRDRYVILPRTIPSRHSLDRFVEEERLSEWLVDDICLLLDRYTVDGATALQMLSDPEDRLVQDLRSVYDQRFNDLIVEPLSQLRFGAG